MSLARQRAEYQIRLEEELAKENELKALEEQLASVKIGWPIFILTFTLAVIADIIDFFTGGTIGWLIGFPIDAILAIILGFNKNGRKQWKKWLAGIAGDSVPVVSTIWLRSVFVLWAFMSSRKAVKGIVQQEKNIANA